MSRLVTGLQPVREAIRVHGERLERVLVEDSGGPQLEAVARFAHDRGCEVSRVPRGELDRAAKGARHQGAIAYAPDLELVPLDALVASVTSAASDGRTMVILALDEIEDPQNFGAIIRSAVALGASTIVWPEHHSAPLSPATFRASAGAVEHAHLCRVASLPNALDRLRGAGATAIGLDAHAPREIREVEATGPVVVVIGAEGKGLRKAVKRSCSELARLSMSGPMDSLNASVAAGIALFSLLPATRATTPNEGGGSAAERRRGKEDDVSG
jgi:23S rRNA (guanosine2251-2'-O)-methyltransferase